MKIKRICYSKVGTKNAVIVGVLLTSLLGCSSEEEKQQQLSETQAITALKSQLIDPDSIKIESITHHQWCGFGTESGQDLPIVKIVYNAKNRMGGYAGASTAYWSPVSANLNTTLDGEFGVSATQYEMALNNPLTSDDGEISTAAKHACESMIDG